MKNSIEEIWKEGFLNEKSLVAPKVNDLYNQKSKDLIDKMKRMYRNNLVGIAILAIVFPIVYYFLDVIWRGLGVSLLMLFTIWYSKRQKRNFKVPDHTATSLDYLKSFDQSLKDSILKGEKVIRFTYPIYFLIAISVIWSAWDKGPVTSKIYQQYPDVIFIGSVPLVAWIIVGLATVLIAYFSDRIYRWDISLVYGRVFRKLEETIAEMETLKHGE
jgi:Na+/H+ antiporter NhaC